jgi:transcriptional regulator with PAS, ATPase and Fis domain
MVKVNCAAIPGNLIESEMFGYIKGAFTGADRDKPGRFQEADGGTIFLDEIGDLPLSLQAKLLRVLEDQEFYPLGSRRTTKVDVRIIAATNRDLRKLVDKRQFREDLFYRLNVLRIELPPLRERRADIPLLIRHIMRRLCTVKKCRSGDISQKTMEVLLNYDYPGNVRELENILEYALTVCRQDIIEPRDLPVYVKSEGTDGGDSSFSGAINNASDKERRKIIRALNENNWHRKKTAETLGIDRTTLWRRMKVLNIVDNGMGAKLNS